MLMRAEETPFFERSASEDVLKEGSEGVDDHLCCMRALNRLNME